MMIMEKNNPLYIGYDKSNDGDNGNKIIHYTLDVTNVMMIMKKEVIKYTLNIMMMFMQHEVSNWIY